MSPPGCLLRRPLLSHPRPRPASVSERLVGTSVWYWTARLPRSRCSLVQSFSSFYWAAVRPAIGTLSFLSAARTPSRDARMEGSASGQEVAFSVKLCRQSVELIWCVCIYMLLVNVSAILIECTVTYSSLFASFKWASDLFLAFKIAFYLGFFWLRHIQLAFSGIFAEISSHRWLRTNAQIWRYCCAFEWTVLFLPQDELAAGWSPNRQTSYEARRDKALFDNFFFFGLIYVPRMTRFIFEGKKNDNLLKISWFRYSVFIYLITFLAFVTIREKRNESKRFWFRVTISFRVALKSLCCTFGLKKKNCTAELQMSWCSLLRRRSPLKDQLRKLGFLFFCFLMGKTCRNQLQTHTVGVTFCKHLQKRLISSWIHFLVP